VTGRQRKATVILLLSSLLLLTWKYYASPLALSQWYPPSSNPPPPVWGARWHFLATLCLMGVLPGFVVSGLFRERLSAYGLSFRLQGGTWQTALLFVPVFAVAGYLSANDPALRTKFPINPQAAISTEAFLLHAVTYFCYYAGWEFYFRGFLLFGLRESTGEVNAVLIQTLASALLHIGSPASETFGAIGGGLLWGLLALRTRSIISGTLQHFALGIALDWAICFGPGAAA
jgi:membrane protease YdiL (CAAX protease family)